MLLERFDETAYRDLSIRSTKSSNGRVTELKALEAAEKKGERKNKTGKDSGDESECPKEGLDDKWLTVWARIDPPLANVDLRQYIYISREKIANFMADRKDSCHRREGASYFIGSAERRRKLFPQLRLISIFQSISRC